MAQVRSNRAVSKRPAGKSDVLKKMRRMWPLYVMMAVGILYIIVFKYSTLYGLVIAFKDYKIKKGIMGSEWVGLANFKAVFSGTAVRQVFENTLVISIMKLIITFPAPIALAILLNDLRDGRFKKTVSTALYMPRFLSWTVFGGILFSLFSSTTGSIPQAVFNLTGIKMPSLITDPKYARGFLYLTELWKGVGWNTIIYTAAIAGIDQTYYEAATVDGATHFQQILHVTLPCIASTIVTLLVLAVGGVMNAGFDQIFNLHSEVDAATNIVNIIDTYVYNAGVKQGNFEYATVVGMTKSVINAILLIAANLSVKKMTGEGVL